MKFMNKKTSIFKQILIPVVLIMIILIFSVLTTVLSLFNSFYEKQIKSEIAEASDSIALNFQSFITGIYRTGEELCANNDIKSMDGRLQTPILVDSAKRNPEVQLFYIQDENGDQTARSVGTCSNRKNRWWFIQEEKTHKPFVSNSYYSVSTGSPCVSIFYPMLKNDYMYGVFGIDLSIESLQVMIEKFSSGNKGRYSFIIDGSGTVTAHPDKKFVEELYNYKTLTKKVAKKDNLGKPLLDGKGNPITEEQVINISDSLKNAISKIIAGDKDTVEAEIEGMNSYISYTPIHFEGNSENWSIITVQPKSKAFSIVRKILVSSIIIGLIILILAILVTSFVSKRIVIHFQSGLSGKLQKEIQNLVVSTKETAATAQDQSAAVKEIVATMEDSNSLSESISQKIKDVSSLTLKTSADVTDGVNALEKNVSQLNEIFTANQNTITGIKALGDKIENIWDIVTLINSVADQAKIIAFNAELEASSAGEAGKNFHIVATEIRRLADGIIDGTKEIKEKINEIQQSSDHLILTSESGTEKINQGCITVKELESKFNSIKTSSEITAKSSSDITGIIQQQIIAFEQILITLKQIASGVENSSQATGYISSSAETLKSIASDLTS